jgi:hypothetical protein
MTVLELRSLSSSDVEVGVWQPGEDGRVCFPLELEIGERGVNGADLFEVIIATPEGLRRLPTSINGVLSDRAAIVFDKFDWAGMRKVLSEILGACSAETWSESLLRLQRYFRWEYEDYKESEERPDPE